MKGLNGELKSAAKSKGNGVSNTNVCVGLGLFVLLYMSAVISAGTVARMVCGSDCFYSLMAQTPSTYNFNKDDEMPTDCGTDENQNEKKKRKLFRFLQPKQTSLPSTQTKVTPDHTQSTAGKLKCTSSICLFCTNLLAAFISPYSFPTTITNTHTQLTQTQRDRPSFHDQHKHKHTTRRAGPVKRIIDQAAAFFKLRKQKSKQKQQHQEQHPSSSTQQQKHIANLWGPDAITPSTTLQYSQTQQSQIHKLSSRVMQTLHKKSTDTDINTRLQNVYWGSGQSSSYYTHATSNNPSFPWWFPNSNDVHAKRTKYYTSVTSDKPQNVVEGYSLLAAYLKIMEWPQNMQTKFPYKLCAKGCDAELAVEHTLEWREKYKPWCVSPSLIKENSIGWIYHRGHAHADVNNKSSNQNDNLGGHSMIWYRPGLYQVQNPELYTRNLMHALDNAVAEALQRTHGTIGKYNLVLDCNNFSFAMMPRIHDVKRGMVMMQDHYPDRLGVLLLANLSGPAQLFLKVITPFITEKVRNKIHALPNDPKARIESLKVLIDEQYIPDWLGGKDTYRFDKKDWYDNAPKCTDEEMLEYLTTMPYHA